MICITQKGLSNSPLFIVYFMQHTYNTAVNKARNMRGIVYARKKPAARKSYQCEQYQKIQIKAVYTAFCP